MSCLQEHESQWLVCMFVCWYVCMYVGMLFVCMLVCLYVLKWTPLYKQSSRDSSSVAMMIISVFMQGVAKLRHTWARARATFACALAFACRSFKSQHAIERRKRLNSNESAS